MTRYAIVRGHNITIERVAAYLPTNYGVIWVGEFENDTIVVIEGKDYHGWTLDKYVIPRLGSGMMAAIEIDLSHPIMAEMTV